MTVLFSAAEILQIAMKIEQNGAAFYKSQAKLAQDKAVRDIYRFLAAQEERHLRIFQDMLQSSEQDLPAETYPEEEPAYVKALADEALFTAEHVAQKTAAPLSSDRAAIRLAIGIEKDSILFYSQLKSLVRRSQQDKVATVIAEEKSHLTQFLELEKKLSPV